jgi:transposase InsO family protein
MAHIPPGSPWENPFVESFNSRLRDEFLNIELFASVQEAKLLAEQHGSPPAMESGLTNPPAFIGTREAKGVTSTECT